MTKPAPNTPRSEWTDAQRFHSNLKVSVVFTSVLTLALLIIMPSIANGHRANATKETSAALIQARLAVTNYQLVHHQLPGINGDRAKLSSSDVLGFPNLPVTSFVDSIKYSKAPTGHAFCLIGTPKSGYAPAFYITSDSSQVTSKKPATC